MNKALKKILYVEDEPDIQTIATIALESGGFEVKCCSSGKEALQVIEGYTPDLILMDVMMPDLDGPSTLKKLKENSTTQKVPTVFMTAKVQANEIENYKKMGAVDVISKPFDPLQLVERIQNIWKNLAE